jgi:hypothetical protein
LGVQAVAVATRFWQSGAPGCLWLPALTVGVNRNLVRPSGTRGTGSSRRHRVRPPDPGRSDFSPSPPGLVRPRGRTAAIVSILIARGLDVNDVDHGSQTL